MPFTKIGLCDELVQGILATGYTAPTEIQAEAIPVAVAGKDMIGCAQTGTGKTAAFVLPILNRLATTGEQSKKRKIRSLIITPTRELAVQIEKAVQGYGRFLKFKSIAVYGGAPIDKQTKFLRSGVDIVVATPGRLIDHIQRRNVDLSKVEVLVLDEADRMLDMGFIQDIKGIIEKTPSNRQTLMFSATMSKEITKLTKNIQRSPKMIQIGTQNNPIETITQHMYPVAQQEKIGLLLYMMQQQQMYSVLIFSRTKRGADRICKKLKQNDIKAESIHSDRTQKQRMRALDGFRSGKFQALVATDVAARGINVEGISHVFNFDVPGFPEDYVHRIGRTGRAEATGDAITLVGYDEIPQIHRIEKFIGQKFKDEYYEGFEYRETLSLKNGPKGPAQKKKVGSSQRRRAQGQRGGQGGGGSQQKRGGAGAGKKRGISSPAKGKSGGGDASGGAKAKKSFKSKSKANHAGSKAAGGIKSGGSKPAGGGSKAGGSKPAGGSFKRSKKKSATKLKSRF